MYRDRKYLANTHAKTREFIRKNAKMTGARVIAQVMARPNHTIGILELCRRMYRPDLTADFVAKLGRGAFPPIPMTDNKALAQYLERRRILEERVANGDTHPDNAWEIAWLTRELHRVWQPGKGIKYEHPELKRAYACLRMGILRFLSKAQKEDREIYFYLRANLKSGYNFRWTQEIGSFGTPEPKAFYSVERAA